TAVGKMPSPPSGVSLLFSTSQPAASLPMSPEVAAAAAMAIGMRASAAALQFLLLLLAADLASRWSQQVAAASAAPSGLGRDYTLRTCGQTLSLEGLDWAGVTWEPPVSQCGLTVLPGAARRVLAWRRTLGHPSPASACYIDLYRWLCLPKQPHCNTLVVATGRHESGALLEPPPASNPAGLSLGETDFLQLLYCGTGGTVLYLQLDSQKDSGNPTDTAGSSSNSVLLGVILPTLLVAMATVTAVVFIGVCARRRRLKRRQIRRRHRSEPPPSYADCVTASAAAAQPEQWKLGSRLSAEQLHRSWLQQQPPPPPYELAVATISLGRMAIVESSDYPCSLEHQESQDASNRCHDNPAFDAGDGDQLGESDSVRMAVGRGMRAQYSRSSRSISQGPQRGCRVTQV
ncbi:hypothetical protein BOX15_Mlig020647g2, partial [Macrostomum lignano]